jgi:OmcA/MtrC family decaheme c-type cytochrome
VANFSTSRATNLVISPISASCFGCHDSTPAVAHMRQNGGVVYSPFGANATSGVNPENCMNCHATGKTADIKTVHRF